MIRGESAGKYQFNILNIGQIESSQSDTQSKSEQEEKHMIKQLYELTWWNSVSSLTGRQVEQYNTGKK